MKEPMYYQVHEMFSSFQGEGMLVGSPATFIRLQGCNVGCSWCDAKRTWGPVLDTEDYKLGKLSAQTAGYAAILPDVTNSEFSRGIVAQLFDDHAEIVNEGDRVMVRFDGSGLRNYADELIRVLSSQDLHPGKWEFENPEVCLFKSDWRVFVDYFRPLTARTKLNIEARKTGSRLQLEDIAGFAFDARNTHIVITGGEPLLWNLDPLLAKLRDAIPGAMIQLETSGQGGFKGKSLPDLITWSPKANLKYDAPFEFKQYVGEVKFVVDEYLPLEVVEATWEWFRRARNYTGADLMPVFTMMPEGCPPSQEAINKALQFARAGGSSMWRVGARLQYAYGVR